MARDVPIGFILSEGEIFVSVDDLADALTMYAEISDSKENLGQAARGFRIIRDELLGKKDEFIARLEEQVKAKAEPTLKRRWWHA